MPQPPYIMRFGESIAVSPEIGVADQRNVDIHSVPGHLRANFALAKESSTTVTDLIKWMRVDPTSGDEFALGDTGKFYTRTSGTSSWSLISGNTVTSAAGNGLEIWKDYAIIRRNDILDTFGPLAGATFTVTIASPAVFSKTAHGLAAGDPIIFSTTGALPTGLTAGTVYYVISAGLTADAFEVSTSVGGSAVNTSGSQSGTHKYKAWKNGWKTSSDGLISDSHWGPLLQGQDDIVYGGNGYKLLSISQTSGQTFNPGTSATFSFNAAALTLPYDNRIKCLAELGVNLMIGTIKGSQLYGGAPGAEVYPWNRSSTSFNIPIDFEDFGVHQLLNVNNLLVVVTGYEGTVHISNGSSTGISKKLPASITNLFGGRYLNFYPDAIMRLKDRVWFGVSSGTASATIDGLGVWSITLDNDPKLTFENQLSTGTTSATNTLSIGSLSPSGSDSYRIGWRDNSTYGIDATDSNYYSSYAAYSRGKFEKVGTNFQPRMFERVAFELDRPLLTNQGVRLKYRTALNAAFTTIGTFDYATYGAIQSLDYQYAIDAEGFQAQVELTGGSSDTPVLREVRFE